MHLGEYNARHEAQIRTRLPKPDTRRSNGFLTCHIEKKLQT